MCAALLPCHRFTTAARPFPARPLRLMLSAAVIACGAAAHWSDCKKSYLFHYNFKTCDTVIFWNVLFEQLITLWLSGHTQDFF